MPAKRPDAPSASILLSIQPTFAAKILAGDKRYELRKAIPARYFERVYLYVSGGGGVVGCFDVKSVLTDTPRELWKRVGDEATSEERFFRYFHGWRRANAIEIAQPVRFASPVLPEKLRRAEPEFIAPQSFYYLTSRSPVLALLEDERSAAMAEQPLALRPIREDEYQEFCDLVDRFVRPHYDEITDAYAKSLLKVSRLGRDPHATLTRRKEVLVIIGPRGGRVGYTVLTSKVGHSVKSGPTLLRAGYRGRGYGVRVRRAIEEYVERSGGAKIYCTAPDCAPRVSGYLLASQYRMEAHLLAHYQPHRGELVFGKMLRPAVSARMFACPRSATRAKVGGISGIRARELAQFIDETFEAMWATGTVDIGANIVRKARPAPGKSGPEHKPCSIMCLRWRKKCLGVVVVLPKRGGAAKAMLLLRTSDHQSIVELLQAAASELKARGLRKIYLIHPILDSAVMAAATGAGFHPEGALAEPYGPGVHAVILSRFL